MDATRTCLAVLGLALVCASLPSQDEARLVELERRLEAQGERQRRINVEILEALKRQREFHDQLSGAVESVRVELLRLKSTRGKSVEDESRPAAWQATAAWVTGGVGLLALAAWLWRRRRATGSGDSRTPSTSTDVRREDDLPDTQSGVATPVVPTAEQAVRPAPSPMPRFSTLLWNQHRS